MEFDAEKSVVLVSFLTSFFAVFLAAGIVIGVPSIASEFGMNNVVQNWIITIALRVVAVFTLPAGQLSGKFGVKRSLVIGVLIFLIGSIASFFVEKLKLIIPNRTTAKVRLVRMVFNVNNKRISYLLSNII